MIKNYLEIRSNLNIVRVDENDDDYNEFLAYENRLNLEEYHRSKDKITLSKVKNVETLIDIYWSDFNSDFDSDFNSDFTSILTLYDYCIVIDEIIEKYSDSECSIKFILSVISPNQNIFLDFNRVRNYISYRFDEFPEKMSCALVTQIKKDIEIEWEYIKSDFNPIHADRYFRYQNYCNILWTCSNSIKYIDFYSAWHSQPISTHPEVTNSILLNNTNKIQTLESQLIDCDTIQEELDRTADHPEIRCLVVDIRHLEQESDPNVLAKKLTNKIFNSIGRRIPVIQDVSCLERELLNLKFDLGVEKLAIALYSDSENNEIEQLCQNLAPIQTRLFTGGQTTQELITKINAWLLEM